MPNPKKKLREYFKKGVRKLKHRKGYGVHSPFAYSIITEVIEEKMPYYAYRRMSRTYDKQAPISYKVACLLFRLGNRFRCRNVVELGCDAGYSLLPLLLLDSRLRAHSYGTAEAHQKLQYNLSWLPTHLPQLTCYQQLSQLDEAQPYDFIIVNSNPFASDAELLEWILSHSQEDTLVWIKGILPKLPLETLWDQICDCDDISVTMDLYDSGLAILRPRFFKQHYIVSF